ncbi:2-C-methyl-D-erythritol 4-phosphate cytidylyltransferase [Sphingobacterium thalpophilum]|uniref:2-C-methyl-D-erythritol 4-phosphate cytidylyltransferase n=1 Tax=Sphingobacterium thalpophilum TaxID=259 RepID=UPI0037D999C5
MNKSELYIVILAGGVGNRFQGKVPKQFSELAGKPLLMHTLDVFNSCPLELKVILVLEEEYVSIWQKMVEHYNFSVPHTVVVGGEERFHSAKNALDIIPDNDHVLVGIHDGVRPFVSQEVILEAYAKAEEYGAVVPAVSTINPIRLYKDERSESLDLYYDRSNIHIVQTPQVFKYRILREAFDQGYHATFRDDSVPVENLGHPIHVIEGNRENIKITFPLDLAFAEVIYPMMFNKD